jgi:hypothetical protein
MSDDSSDEGARARDCVGNETRKIVPLLPTTLLLRY